MLYSLQKRETDEQNKAVRNVIRCGTVEAVSFWDAALVTRPRKSWTRSSAAPSFGKNFAIDGPEQNRRPMLCAALQALLQYPEVRRICLLSGDFSLADYIAEAFPSVYAEAEVLAEGGAFPDMSEKRLILFTGDASDCSASELDQCLCRVQGHCAVILHDFPLAEEEDKGLIAFIQKWKQLPHLSFGVSAEDTVMWSAVAAKKQAMELLQGTTAFAIFKGNMQSQRQNLLDVIGAQAQFRDAMQNSHSVGPEHLLNPIPMRTVRGMHTGQHLQARLLATDPDISAAFAILYGHSGMALALTQHIVCGRAHLQEKESGLHALLSILYDLIFFDHA